jgi:hypothetical protein
MLLAFGQDLPKWGADGWYGTETDDASYLAQLSLQRQGYYGGAIDRVVGPATMEAMQAYLDAKEPARKTKSHLTIVDGVEVHDYRGHVAPPKNGRHVRDWKNITGLVLHRTACRLGERPQRYFPVNCHIGVTLGGRIILPHPWALHIWHGHRPSIWTVGIEFDGNPEGKPGRDGEPGYHWKPGGGPDPITDAQVKAGGVLIQMLAKTFAANGTTIDYIYAHRQSSENRECDPGWECWQKIALPWMDITGATPGDSGRQGTTFGTGYHIPKSWDPTSPVTSFRSR